MNILADVMQHMTDDLLRLGVLVAGIGALAMAIVEAIKGLFPVRALFHRGEIRHWFEGRHASLDVSAMGIPHNALPSAAQPDAAFTQLLRLAIGGEEYQTALFEQAPEKMFGQIQAAVNIALDFPDTAPDLYEFLTHDPAWPTKGVERVARKVAMANAAAEAKHEAQRPDQDVWREFARELHAGRVNARAAKVEDRGDYLAANQARQRLDNLVRRRLDALQTRIAYRWSRGNQVASFLVAFALSLIALLQVREPNYVASVFLAVIAGFLAPPAKDLVAALKQIRYR